MLGRGVVDNLDLNKIFLVPINIKIIFFSGRVPIEIKLPLLI